MPILDNQQHELFCQGVVSGLPAGRAYVKAGYSKTGADQSANRLLRNVKIRERIVELKAKTSAAIESKRVLTRESVIERLFLISRDAHAAGQHAAAARCEELLGKEVSMFVDRKDITVKTRPEDFTDVELAVLASAPTEEPVQ